MQSGIDRVVQLAGGQAALARVLGVKRQAVQQWVSRGWPPPSRILEIEAQYGVSRFELIDPQLRDLVSPDAGE